MSLSMFNLKRYYTTGNTNVCSAQGETSIDQLSQPMSEKEIGDPEYVARSA